MYSTNRQGTFNSYSRCAGMGLCALILLLVSAGHLQAATVSEYRDRINSAVVLLNRLSSEESQTENIAMAATFNEVRGLLPAQENVEAATGSWQVNNLWLHQSLSECEKATAGPARMEKLNRIVARLQALGVRLSEIQNATPADSISKNKNKAKLQEILQRSEYQKKPPEMSALAKLWQRFLRWLGSLFPQSEPITRGSSSDPGSGAMAVSKGAQILVVTLALTVIAYVLWKLLPIFLRNRRPGKKRKREARIVLGERLEPDQTAGDLLADAEVLARTGDLRAAIRKGYIALLCELGDRKIVRLAQHKTNRDYLGAVRDIAPLHGEMRQLTRSFEAHWYGFIPATDEEWASFRAGYHRALSFDQHNHP